VHRIYIQRQEEENKRIKPIKNLTGFPYQCMYTLHIHEDKGKKRKEKKEKKRDRSGSNANTCIYYLYMKTRVAKERKREKRTSKGRTWPGSHVFNTYKYYTYMVTSG